MRVFVLIFGLATFTFAQDLAVGERIYKTKCANCHSVDGSASSPLGRRLALRDLASPEVQSQSDDQLARIIGEGQRGMPALRHVSDSEFQALVGYIRSLPKIPSSTSSSSAVNPQAPTPHPVRERR